MTKVWRANGYILICLHYMLAIRMGRKTKISRVFGHSLGRHRKIKQNKYLGRPIYTITKSKHLRKEKLRLKIRKTHRQYKTQRTSYKTNGSLYASYASDCSLKLKIRKIKDLSPKGYRIINLDCLQSHISDVTLHVCLCPDAMKIASAGRPPIKLESELRSYGLASVMLAQCQGCSQKFSFDSSPKVPGSKRFDINVRAVWGSMVTGNGPSHLNEFMATLNSPGLSQPSFSAIETDIGKWWHNVLLADMLAAGQEERRLAIERKDYHEEVPAITVITDGGWSKRTHKHSYNAAGGVAIIIGKETKNLLHIGVRNKYCYLCNHKSSKPHTCFKNWDHDSQSMEGDIILEGFLEAESKHGLRYMRLVGDGDSSVFSRIRQEVPGWGRYVAKEECANHICKCYRTNLEKLVSDNQLYKGRHHLSKTTRVRLVSAIRCAIRVRSKEYNDKKCDKNTATKRLSNDIRKSVHHIFGQHQHCSDFCRAKIQPPQHTQTDSTSCMSSCQPGIEETDLIEEQVDYWNEGSSIDLQEESRYGTSIDYQNVEKHIIKDVTLLLSKIADKSDRLINNSTTNLAESWMHIRTKFDGGKVYNLCNRGSWHARCYGGALRMNLGPEWSCKVWEDSTGTEPGYHFRKLYSRRDQTLKNSLKHKSKPNVQHMRWKKKITTIKTSTTKKARRAYGPEAIDITDDVSQSDVDQLQQSFIENHVNLSAQQCKTITTSTIQQSHSGLWHSERKKKITASNFGTIVKRNPSIPIKKLVRNMLYSTFHGNRHTRNGILQEDTTIEEYKLKKAEENENVIVHRSGLVIHPEQRYIAGSPDGIVSVSTGETGLVEIKNLLHSKPINLWQASLNKNFCLENINGKLQLKPNHNYFYQCQGLLNICNRDWIDFIVRTLNPHQIFIQRIQRDQNLWENIMLPKLQAFYFKALLPELASPRDGKCPGIREPGLWYVTVVKSKRKKRTSLASRPCRKKPCKPTSGSDTPDTDSQAPVLIHPRRTRQKQNKFLGRTIQHEWIVDETSQQKEWYKGTVMSVISGNDGKLNAVYEVLYDGDDDAYVIDHLIQDFHAGSVVFCDL